MLTTSYDPQALPGHVTAPYWWDGMKRDHSSQTESLFMGQAVRDLGSHLRKLIGAYT